MEGTMLKMKPIKKYIIRPKESKIKYQRRSIFGSSLDSQQWVTYLDKYTGAVQELMKLTPNKRHFYQRGMRAVTLIMSSF
jgi:hypothetical protein